MKKILIFGLMLLMVLPFAFAREVQDIDLDIWVNISNRDGKYYLTLIINNQDYKDFDDSRFELNETFTDSFDNLEVEITCEETEFFDLTTALIDTNREVIASCQNADNMTAKCGECFEGIGKVREIKDQYKSQLDDCNNESGEFRLLYESETSAKDEFEDSYKSCNTNLLNRNTDYNSCMDDLRTAEKKPANYAIIGVIITLIIVVMYYKGKEPKSPEFSQFPER